MHLCMLNTREKEKGLEKNKRTSGQERDQVEDLDHWGMKLD